MHHVAIISGYSRSGKTTALEYCRYKNLNCVDTSEYLKHKVIEFYYSIDKTIPIDPDIFFDYLVDKNDEFFLARYNKSARDIQIDFAEYVIVPRFGRAEGIIHPAIESQLDQGSINVFITIGGEEYSIAKKWFLNHNYNLYHFNIVRPDHDRFADSRQHLAHAQTIYNDGTLAMFYRNLEDFVISRVTQNSSRISLPLV